MDKNTLYKFFEGTASFAEEEAIRLWMEASPENNKAFLKERKLFDAMLLLAKENSIDIFKRKLKVRYSSLRTELIKIAVVVTLTLCVNFIYEQKQFSHTPVAMQTIRVPAGQRINLTLPDGTNVWLNARTTLQYPIAFNTKERLVRLDGQAYFDVSKNKKKPFIVQTNNYKVEVLGTQFDVDSYSDSEGFETTLMEGSIKISSLTEPSENLILKPHSKVYLQNGKLQVAAVNDYTPFRWKEGLICFKEATFASIMKEFEKYYGISIYIKNEQVQKYFYTGKFRQVDGIDYALRVLQKDIHFTYRRNDDSHIIYID